MVEIDHKGLYSYLTMYVKNYFAQNKHLMH
jgi:hypothetical protein